MRREVVVEQLFVFGAGEQILKRRRGVLVAVGFLHDRADGNFSGDGSGTAAGGNGLAHEFGRVQPGAGRGDRVESDIGELVRGARGGIGDPEFDAVGCS